MKLTKRIMTLTLALAMGCTFAVSAAPSITAGDITADGTGYAAAFTPAELAADDQITILVQKVSGEIVENTGSLTIAAPSSADISYINQDSLSAFTDDDAYTIAFALGAINGDGTYRVLIGGTDVATAAVGFFTVGENAPTYTLGDCDGEEGITVGDANAIVNHVLGLKLLAGDNLLAADCDGETGITVGDANAVVNHVLGLKLLGAE